MSCNRHDLLNETMYTFINHMEKSGVPYQVVVMEQCSTFEDFQKNVMQRFEVDHFAFKTWNTGIGYGMNSLLQLCTTRYVFSLEDDWKFATEDYTWIPRALDVLKYHNQLHIEAQKEPEKYKNYTFTGPVYQVWATRMPIHYRTELMRTTNGTEYWLLDPKKNVTVEVAEGEELGNYHYANVGLFDLYWMRKIGFFCYRDDQHGIEGNYKHRVKNLEYRPAYLSYDWHDGRKVFYTSIYHLGGGNRGLSAWMGPNKHLYPFSENSIENPSCYNRF
eukprot:TRINITY_DN1413_c0_g1_i3.p1 TRINITY_DN1413_c0_g1~~TRINITY_DN1413_c0_g1_i3.p1  ORF type:complete len:275 (+),score=22.92 TRINITY_DN1413_c0_g1_i3:347-1171(+)